MSDDEGSDDWRSSDDRLADLRMGILDGDKRQRNPKTATIQVFLSGICARDERQQLNAIQELNDLLLSVDGVRFDDFPSNFCETIVDIFFDETVSFHVRTSLLSFFDLFCERGPQYVDALAACTLYSKLFRLCSAPRCLLQLDKWLAVLAHFIRVSPIAFSYFRTVNFVEFLDKSIQTRTKQLDRELLLRAMAQYALSSYFDPSIDEKSSEIMLRYAKNVLDSHLLQKPTSLVGYAIEMLASVMSRSPKVDAFHNFHRDGISAIILELIQVENLQISRDCAFYLATVTHNSNVVCDQLVESDIFLKLIDALYNPGIFDECTLYCFTAMYNCLVAHPEKSADIVQSRDEKLNAVIRKVLDLGSLETKQVVLDFLAIIIYNVYGYDALELAAKYDFFRHVPIILESGDLDVITNAVAAARKIIQALESNPQFRDQVKKEMVSMDALEILEASMEKMRPEVQELAQVYHDWMAKNIGRE